MKVLTVTDVFTLGGLETRIQGEFHWAQANGIETFLATSAKVLTGNLPRTARVVETGLPISSDATAMNVISAMERLTDLVERHGIQVIHAHPLYSCLPAFLAAQQKGIPLVLSLHGPASVNPWHPDTSWHLQRAFVFPYASLLACVSSETKDLLSQQILHDRVEIFPNCVDLDKFSPTNRKDSKTWALISRLDKDKQAGIEALLTMLPSLPIPALDIIGDGEAKAELEHLSTTLNLNSTRVRFLGASYKVNELIGNYAGIIGMGRVALEAAANGLPVILIGSDGVKGLFNVDLMTKAAYSNYSGRGLPNISKEQLFSALSTTDIVGDAQRVRAVVEQDHDEKLLWSRFFNVIRTARFISCPLSRDIVTAFQSCVGSNQPYGADKRLHDEIQALIEDYGRRCFRSIDESPASTDIYCFADVARGWNQASVETERIKESMNAAALVAELDRIKATVSWRITGPLRAAANVVKRINRQP